MKNLLREPLFQFAILGVLLFAYFYMQTETQAAAVQPDQIIITTEDAGQLVEQYQSVWRRAPNVEELQALIDSGVQDEILVREALALGLDRGDAVIRNRLRQKMMFLTDSAAQALEPEDSVLEQHLQDQAEQFSTPAKVSIQQVFLGEVADTAAVAAAQKQLAEGQPPVTIGVRSLLPSDVTDATQAQIDAAFGNGFFEAVTSSEVGTWAGPFRSGYGYHLVRVDQMTAAQPAELAEVRDQVLFDWRRVKAQELADAQIEVLRKRYDIQTPDQQMLQDVLSK